MSTDDSTPTARVRRSPEAARDNILAAAEAILIEAGPQNLKLAEVARAAGVANASVLHHFGSIDGLQTALMTRMIEQLVARVMAISEQTIDPGAMAGASTAALFDAFEERGVARLAAWLELTGESRRLTLVREAVQAVVAVRTGQLGVPAPQLLEDFILLSITMALGVGLFGSTLSVLLGRPESRARELALGLLEGRVRDALAGPKMEPLSPQERGEGF
jgi:AcrR family transcriptional regulator